MYVTTVPVADRMAAELQAERGHYDSLQVELMREAFEDWKIDYRADHHCAGCSC